MARYNQVKLSRLVTAQAAHADVIVVKHRLLLGNFLTKSELLLQRMLLVLLLANFAFASSQLLPGISPKTRDPGNEVEENHNLHSKLLFTKKVFLPPLSLKFTIKEIIFFAISKVVILLLIIYF